MTAKESHVENITENADVEIRIQQFDIPEIECCQSHGIWNVLFQSRNRDVEQSENLK